ncbi:hypothetical protein ACU5AX_11625 [Sphingomonas sp. XXL09]|uniref:hypothetical protein n=1 Tax=Sphingomonas sp. XXL09 TaxID=3457787 RepID=UPI00406BD75D
MATVLARLDHAGSRQTVVIIDRAIDPIWPLASGGATRHRARMTSAMILRITGRRLSAGGVAVSARRRQP